MSGKPLILNVPEPLASEVEAAGQELLVELLERGLRELKIDRALELYTRGRVSFGAAAERAGTSQSELARYAHARGLEPPFSARTLDEELA